MKKEISCITSKGKITKKEWENDDSDFLWALWSAYEKLGQFLFHYYILVNLFKERYISSVKSYKYLNNRVPINFSKLCCEKLYSENLLILA